MTGWEAYTWLADAARLGLVLALALGLSAFLAWLVWPLTKEMPRD